MPDLTLEIVLLLAMAAFLAGFIDSIAGGGGLITVPALLLAGYPPVVALGTNKLQGLFGSGSATLSYAMNGHVDLKAAIALGTCSPSWGLFWVRFLATRPAAEHPSPALPPLLVRPIALYFALKPRLDDVARTVGARRRVTCSASPWCPFIGFYDGVVSATGQP